MKTEKREGLKRWKVKVATVERGHDIGYPETLNWHGMIVPWEFADRRDAEALAALLLKVPQTAAVRIVEFFDGERAP